MARPLPTHDRLGRPQRDPHRLFSHIEGINWIAERVPPVKVPGPAWSQDADDEGEPVAVVACPCGHNHLVPLLEAPLGCSVEECECERAYVFTPSDVWCFNSPAAKEANTVAP